MPAYHFQIRKTDHQNPDGTCNLNVHVYYAEKTNRKLLGHYHIPALEPIIPAELNLNEIERKVLSEWLHQPEQVIELQNCLNEPVFNLHKIAQQMPEVGKVIIANGETYINISIPVAKRLGT
jgi:transcription initiation factor IIF auxiliary subunit